MSLSTKVEHTGPPTGRILSLNVGQVRRIEWLGREETTAIWKHPVEGSVLARGVSLVGDEQADKRVHGGYDKAVYVYAREDEERWEQELGRPLEVGSFGENLTLTGVDVTGAIVGQRWKIGTALFEVAQPRIPCWKLGARMGDPDFPVLFSKAGRPGAYLRIIEEGEIAAGDEVKVEYTPDRSMTVGEVANIYHNDNTRAAELLSLPDLAERLQDWARRRLAHNTQE